MKLRETPKEQRPYERCMNYGVQSLTDIELLAIILRTGSKQFDVMALAHNILNMSGPRSGLGSLMHKSYEELLEVKGIGSIKAIQLLCIGEISKRIWRRETSSQNFILQVPSFVLHIICRR